MGGPDRLGVGGWRYGGYLTNVIVTRTGRFKAAVAGASISNFYSLYRVDDASDRLEREFGLPWEEPARWTPIAVLPRGRSRNTRARAAWPRGRSNASVAVRATGGFEASQRRTGMLIRGPLRICC